MSRPEGVNSFDLAKRLEDTEKAFRSDLLHDSRRGAVERFLEIWLFEAVSQVDQVNTVYGDAAGFGFLFSLAAIKRAADDFGLEVLAPMPVIQLKKKLEED